LGGPLEFLEEAFALGVEFFEISQIVLRHKFR
jgi:hypothetical protein